MILQTPVFCMRSDIKHSSVHNWLIAQLPFLGKLKRDHFIFFLCVVIASLFWLLIKLSDVYRVTYVFKIAYNHVPLEKKLTSLVDSTLTVDVTARGYALLDMGFSREDVPLVIDLRNYQLISDKGNEYYIFTQELRNRLAEKLNVDESNIILSENRLSFILETLSSKKVPVVARYDFKFKDQFGAYLESRITPQTVTVFGPASALDTLKNIFTNKLVLNDIDRDIKVELGLQNPAPKLLSFSVDKVVLEEDVERFTESSVTVPVNVGVRSFTIKTFPSNVKIIYKVAQKDFNLIQPAQFDVTIDTKGVDLKSAKKLHLVLDRAPVNVSNVRLVPADVEFLIIK